MTPVLQTRFGSEGNCWPACLATIFDVPLAEVDHCACHNEDWSDRTEKWLSKRGLFQCEIQISQDAAGRLKFPIIAPPEGTICVYAGKRFNSSLRHVVVARVKHRAVANPEQCELTFEIVHDPLGEFKPFFEHDCLIFFAETFI